MTKTELRTTYVGNGWTVQPVAEWSLVSSVDGVVKYDANVVSPDNVFGTAQVVVTDDGGGGEDATPLGFWVDADESFDAAVRSYAQTLEGGSLFAVAVTQTYPADEVALATAYMTDGTATEYVVKRRSDTFSQQALS